MPSATNNNNYSIWPKIGHTYSCHCAILQSLVRWFVCSFFYTPPPPPLYFFSSLFLAWWGEGGMIFLGWLLRIASGPAQLHGSMVIHGLTDGFYCVIFQSLTYALIHPVTSLILSSLLPLPPFVCSLHGRLEWLRMCNKTNTVNWKRNALFHALQIHCFILPTELFLHLFYHLLSFFNSL